MALATKEPEGLLNTTTATTDRFLWQALRSEPAPWTELSGSISAGEVSERCQHHGVSALLFHKMRESEEWRSWPPELRLALGAASKAAVAAELLRRHHLGKLLSSFSGAGIRFLLAKGEALAHTHYPVPGTRTRCDSDLFIAINDIEKATQAILDAGFRITSAIYKTHQITARLMEGDSGGLEFDIHWRILNSARYARSISFDEAWAYSVELPEMRGVRTLCPIHSLMLACMHRVGSEWHDQDRLIWIYDIHVMVSGMSHHELVDFASHAVGRNVQAACLHGLDIAHKCFDTAVPDGVVGALKTPQLTRRFAQSNLGLLVDDWMHLPTGTARWAILRELFLPSSSFLLEKHHKLHKIWLPILYMRQIFGGIVRRLALR